MSVAAAEDWEATTIIYGVDDNHGDNDPSQNSTITTLLDTAGGLLQGSIQLDVPLGDFVFGRQLRPFDPQKPRYRLWVLQQPPSKQTTNTKQPSNVKEGEGLPTGLSLQFRLVFWGHSSKQQDGDSDVDEQLYDRVEVKLLSPYPHSFPPELKFPWLEWLTKQANTMLQEEHISYAVCDFVQHQALEFFPRLWENHNDNTRKTLVVFEDDGPAFYDVPTLATATTVKRLLPLQRQHLNGSKEFLHDTSTLFRPEQTLIVPLLIHWRRWLPIECPICFEIVPSRDAVIVSCDHGFCRSCLTTYLRIKGEEIHADNANNVGFTILPAGYEGQRIIKKQ